MNLKRLWAPKTQLRTNEEPAFERNDLNEEKCTSSERYRLSFFPLKSLYLKFNNEIMRLFWEKKREEVALKEEDNNVVEVKDLLGIQHQMILMMEEVLQQAENLIPKTLLPEPLPENFYSDKIPEKIQARISMGFSNSKEVIEYKKELDRKKAAYSNELEKVRKYNREQIRINQEREKLLEIFRFYLRARDKYGPNTVLLPEKKFVEILNKYNLICGRFESYTGNIPEDKVEELQQLLSIEDKDHLPEINSIYPITRITGVDSDDISRVKGEVEKIPFFVHKRELFNTRQSRDPWGVYQTVTYGDGFLYTLIDGSQVRTNTAYTNDWGDQRSKIISTNPIKFFIAAPKDLFNDRVSITLAPKTPKDPLICAKCRYGILVTVRWGEEANDEVIQRFEAFNNNLKRLGL